MDIRAEIEVAVPAATAWALVGEQFGDIATWAAPITASAIDGPVAVGAVRTCQVSGFGAIPARTIRERLVTFDPERRSLSYLADGMPVFVTEARNRWSVHPLGDDACIVRVHATLTLRPVVRPFARLLRRRMAKDSAAVFEELVHRLEHGEPHPRKTARGGATVRE